MIKKNKRNVQERWKVILLFLITFTIIYALIITAVAPRKYDLQQGDIASIDIKATRDAVDEVATKEKQEEAIARVEKQFTLRPEVKIKAEENLTNLFEKVSNVNSTDNSEAEKIDSLKKVEGFKLSDSEYKTLLALSKEEISNLKWFTLDTIDLVYSENISENNLEQIQRAQNIVNVEIGKKGFERNIEDIIRDICNSQIKPNYFFDKEKMEEAVRQVEKNVPKEIIKKNQTIVKEGDPITERHIEILRELGLLDRGVGKNYIYIYMSLLIFVAVVLGVQYYYLEKEREKLLYDNKILAMVSAVNICMLLFTRLLTMISGFLIPLSWGTILLTVLIDYRISMVINLLNLLFITVVVGFNPQIVMIAIMNIVLGAILFKKVQQRNDILISSIYIGIASVVIVLVSGLLTTNNISVILSDIGLTMGGVLLSGVLVVGFLPIFESVFDVVTNIKLLELSNPNQPLMRRLLMEAPGTYHHSIMVANLAEVATEEVGGNPSVARIGAYYHDIGKIKKPYFFGENQVGRDNPHNNITPKLSALIILSHVKDGLELAKENKVPKIIQDIIQQHHGTTLVKYFYYTLKNSSTNPDEVNEEDFMYSGPTPISKEAGIIMLADSVEAAVRSINEPSKMKIENMVSDIIKDKIASNQLVNCDLTLKDIEIIKGCFLKVLMGIYHQRIEYPTEKK